MRRFTTSLSLWTRAGVRTFSGDFTAHANSPLEESGVLKCAQISSVDLYSNSSFDTMSRSRAS
jgi:hypothetical protein